MLTRDQIQRHIDELDAQIPRGNAEVSLSRETDSGCYRITANCIGCLRFGVDLLKAAIVELEPGTVDTNVSLHYMEDRAWFQRGKIIRREDVRRHLDREFVAKFSPDTSLRGMWRMYREIFLIMVFPVVCLVIGFLEIVAWFRSLLY